VDSYNKRLIKNYSALIDHGHIKERKDALAILEEGIHGAHPGKVTADTIRLNNNILFIGTQAYPLDTVGRIFIVGAGKGSLPIAQTLEDILGDRISDGVLAVKGGDEEGLKYIRVMESGHPLPDENSVNAAEEIFRIANEAGENDIVFAIMTGGASALATLPPHEIDLPAIKTVTDILLRSGAVIQNTNTVRKHLCRLKGGKLIKHIQPALSVTLTLNTAPHDMPWPDMCLPDETTFSDAIKVLKSHELWESTPKSIRDYFQKNINKSDEETIVNFDGMNQKIFFVSDVLKSTEAAAMKAKELGYTPFIIGTEIGGEARDLGVVLAGIVTEVIERNRPFTRPCALISGGETIVRVDREAGKGGPNQETVLGFIQTNRHTIPLVCACIDTDGTDGPTEIAGAIADGLSKKRVEELGFDLEYILRRHDSSQVLTELEDVIITGHTGTNMMNLRVVLIP
jgi:glycerate 2-kinase